MSVKQSNPYVKQVLTQVVTFIVGASLVYGMSVIKSPQEINKVAQEVILQKEQIMLLRSQIGTVEEIYRAAGNKIDVLTEVLRQKEVIK